MVYVFRMELGNAGIKQAHGNGNLNKNIDKDVQNKEEVKGQTDSSNLVADGDKKESKRNPFDKSLPKEKGKKRGNSPFSKQEEVNKDGNKSGAKSIFFFLMTQF
jgi:hypothetical protein